MLYVVIFKIRETNYLQEEGVIAPHETEARCKEDTLEEQDSATIKQ